MQFTVDIAGIAAIIIALVALYKAWKTTPKEAADADASASTKYAQAAGLAVDTAASLMKRVDELEAEVTRLSANLEQQTNIYKEQIGKRDRQIAAWQKGIDRLIHQICSLGHEPVWKPSDENTE